MDIPAPRVAGYHAQMTHMAHFLATAFLVTLLLSAPAMAEDWPGWRGPRGDGTSAEADVPVRWNGTPGAEENIAWKVAVPGSGHASPVVSAGRVFLASAL